MHDPIRGISYAAIAGAAMLLSSAAIPAQAQGVPGGSYLQSCTNVRMHGDRLVAECRRADGSWDRTALNVSGCAGGIANTNGNLTCNHVRRNFGAYRERGWEGYGSSRGYGPDYGPGPYNYYGR